MATSAAPSSALKKRSGMWSANCLARALQQQRHRRAAANAKSVRTKGLPLQLRVYSCTRTYGAALSAACGDGRCGVRKSIVDRSRTSGRGRGLMAAQTLQVAHVGTVFYDRHGPLRRYAEGGASSTEEEHRCCEEERRSREEERRSDEEECRSREEESRKRAGDSPHSRHCRHRVEDQPAVAMEQVLVPRALLLLQLGHDRVLVRSTRGRRLAWATGETRFSPAGTCSRSR
eukprot:COSAG04_NODE_3644_length_2642_cov_2.753441_3_plen_230_part_01